MHERGMLHRIDHPELGEVVLPGSPIRIHETSIPELVPSPSLGQHNDEIYGTWLGLSEEEIAGLRERGVI